MTMSSINEPCYGILCHRQYVDRVSNALLAIDDEWRTIDGKKEEVTPTSTSPSVDQSSKCLLVPTSMEKGPRKSRTGFSLLVMQNCIMSPAQLPPTARRQLSWAGRLSHKTEIKSPCVAEEENNITGKKRTRSNEKEEDEQSDSYLSIINTVAAEIWKDLTCNGFDIDKEVLRIDAHPKTINSNSELAQVFEDEHLLDKIASLRGIDTSGKDSKHLLLNHGSGLDVGASPGGWTQVLCNQLCIPTVALDPAVLAKRVDSLDGVTHIRAELNSKEAIEGISQHAPYSTIVCDACLSNPKTLIEKIFEALESVKQVLKESGNEKGRVVTFPLCTVFTLKFPHKTTGSIARFIDTTSEALPDYFRRFATLGGQGNVEVTYKICHLFANSISERTVIAVFNKK
ncbi:hypothetical protein QTG54_008743 [Skeletonema marinoi]|uniref:Ribosomal RNA methyltransferase FtsJ domain-containing protein n=1 Tax=Skeletonema marinoi TaxID=267567 RepID=A0AAD8Y6Q3_9STRA|nr:hypothetical protein QTG54_008743 [Skeletonema marinoi]